MLTRSIQKKRSDRLQNLFPISPFFHTAILCVLGFYLGSIIATKSTFAQNSRENPRGKASGKIIVYRIWRLGAIARSLPVTLDSQPRIKLENGYYWTFAVSPGDHFLIRSGDFGIKDRIQVHVDPNQTIYVDAHYGAWSTFFEVAEDQNEAQQRVSNLKQQTSTR